MNFTAVVNWKRVWCEKEELRFEAVFSPFSKWGRKHLRHWKSIGSSAKEIWKRSFIPQYRPHYSATKTELFENALPTSGIRKYQLFDFMRRENILKTELSENDVTSDNFCPSFPQTQIQNDRRLLRLEIPLALVWPDLSRRDQTCVFDVREATILDKINGTSAPPLPPHFNDAKWRVFAPLLFGGKGVNCSLLFCPRL